MFGPRGPSHCPQPLYPEGLADSHSGSALRVAPAVASAAVPAVAMAPSASADVALLPFAALVPPCSGSSADSRIFFREIREIPIIYRHQPI